MGVRVLENSKANMACLYCSTTDWAFGPLFQDREAAEDFLKWLVIDPRSMPDHELEGKHSEWFCLRGEKRVWEEEEEMGTYVSVAKRAGLDELTAKRFCDYMVKRWANEEELQCRTGYAMEWALRFKNRIEFGASDSEGQAILRRMGG